MEAQTSKAIQFRQLHRGPGVLILPNVWDVASARIFEDAGFPAIATTSAGIAYSWAIPTASGFRARKCWLASAALFARCRCP